jgi:hypothetical protein
MHHCTNTWLVKVKKELLNGISTEYYKKQGINTPLVLIFYVFQNTKTAGMWWEKHVTPAINKAQPTL